MCLAVLTSSGCTLIPPRSQGFDEMEIETRVMVDVEFFLFSDLSV